jgi:hypothetical protein
MLLHFGELRGKPHIPPGIGRGWHHTSLTRWGLVLRVEYDLRVSSSWWPVDACWGSNLNGWCLYVEAAASGTMVVSTFMRRICGSAGLGDNLVSLVRRGCRLDRCAFEKLDDF